MGGGDTEAGVWPARTSHSPRKAGGTGLSPSPHLASVRSKQGHAEGAGVGFTEGWSWGGGGTGSRTPRPQDPWAHEVAP